MNLLKRLSGWIADVLSSELKKPLTDLRQELGKLSGKLDSIALDVTALQRDAHDSRIFDLSIGEDRIVYRINRAIERGYRTAEERRLIPNLYSAYKLRGGNHSADQAYKDFQELPTEEEFRRREEKKDED